MASGGTCDVAVLCTETVGTRAATVASVVAFPTILGSDYRRVQLLFSPGWEAPVA